MGLHDMYLTYRNSIERQGHSQLTAYKLLTKQVYTKWQDHPDNTAAQLSVAAAVVIDCIRERSTIRRP